MRFADPIDEAAAREQVFIESAIAAARIRSKLKETGKCYWCGERVGKGNFCDEFCRCDYEKKIKADKQRVLS